MKHFKLFILTAIIALSIGIAALVPSGFRGISNQAFAGVNYVDDDNDNDGIKDRKDTPMTITTVAMMTRTNVTKTVQKT